ncbi:hypothetical protein COLO4_15159 [Corchorus olitorius]|uniref:Uncharacterized protein n=1 Tax=Corchorus olitorius TaxID=93759 RepID=A0A1R3JPD6_9ROSI|nr:hypothetical protein COLO4_15159 [Corchorus olitorius]
MVDIRFTWFNVLEKRLEDEAVQKYEEPLTLLVTGIVILTATSPVFYLKELLRLYDPYKGESFYPPNVSSFCKSQVIIYVKDILQLNDRIQLRGDTYTVRDVTILRTDVVISDGTEKSIETHGIKMRMSLELR